MLPGKEVPHRVAEFKSVAIQQANGSFNGCATSQCLGIPELNALQTPLSQVPSAVPFPDLSMLEEPDLQQGSALPGDIVPQSGSCQASKSSQPHLIVCRILAFPYNMLGEKIYSRL